MKSISKALLLGITFLLLTNIKAQNNSGEIQGKVFEAETGEALPFANVYVKIGEQLVGSTTDYEGKFTLKPLKPGIYNVSISFVGLATKEIKGVQVKPEKISYIKDCYLVSSILMPDIDIEAWKTPIIDKGNPSIQSIGVKQIQQSPLMRSPVELISVTVPGVNVDVNGGVSIRGARTGDVGYYIDGVKSNSLEGLPGRAIGNMSVYTGGVPAQYGDVTGGVIIVETVSYFDLYNAEKAKNNK